MDTTYVSGDHAIAAIRGFKATAFYVWCGEQIVETTKKFAIQGIERAGEHPVEVRLKRWEPEGSDPGHVSCYIRFLG